MNISLFLAGLVCGMFSAVCYFAHWTTPMWTAGIIGVFLIIVGVNAGGAGGNY